MVIRSDPGSIKTSILLARSAGILSIVVSALVLAGWCLHVPLLECGLPHSAPMKPASAVCFLLAGTALVLSTRPGDFQTPPAARWAAIAIGAIVFASYVVDAGRIAPVTTLSLLCLAITTLVQDARFLRAARLAEICGLSSLIMGLFSCLGYLFRLQTVHALPFYLAISFPSSVLMLLMGAGVLLARPSRGLAANLTSAYSGGVLARRVLPLCILAPIALGWFRLVAQQSGVLVQPELGATIFVTVAVLVFSSIPLLNAGALNRSDAENRQAADAIRLAAAELVVANEQFRVSEERFALFMRHLPASAFLKDHKGRYIWGNAAWRKTFPDTWGDLTGKTDAELWPGPVAAALGSIDHAVLQERRPLQEIETSESGKDARHWLVSKFPVEGSDGAVLIGGIAIDATAIKRLEKQLYQAQKLEAIGLLAGGVAHDFNNLLTIIMGYADVASNAFIDGVSPVQSLEEVQRAARQAALLTGQLLAFGRKQISHPTMLAVNDVVREMEGMLRRVLRADISLIMLLHDELGTVKADSTQIQQVIINLVMNARDALPGGGTIMIETSNAEMNDLRSDVDQEIPVGGYVLLKISDNGSGIDPETLVHIFEPFFSTKEVGKGTGLGLATVYGIVRQSGGYIAVDSAPGGGTAFRVYFPRTGDQLEKTALPEALVSDRIVMANPGQKILVVEDEEAVRSLIVKACARAGYKVLQAASGDEAVLVLEAHPERIDLLITDIVMPGMSGTTLAAHVFARRPETRVLYCSGYSGNSQAVSDVSLLEKPFSPAVLLQRIRSVLAPLAASKVR